jgi:hypothetical protein
MRPEGFIRFGCLAAVVGGGALIRAALGHLEVRKVSQERRP